MRNNEKGQALLLIVVVLGIVLMGGMGLAIDGAQIYSHRQLAQAAADAAAEAAVFSIFNKTYTPTGVAYNCTTSDTSTACVYAARNGFGTTVSDTVAVSFPASPQNGVNGSANYTYPFVQVRITRALSTSFMQFFGTTSTDVSALAIAGIIQKASPIPIVVMHPTLSPAFSLQGSPIINIIGGPKRSIQVNSTGNPALSLGGSAVVDLTLAGPNGTGADLGSGGPPIAAPGGLRLGTGKYVEPAAYFKDPLADVPEPSNPGVGSLQNSDGVTGPGNSDNPPAGTHGCPASPAKTCHLYSPGLYNGSIQVKNETAVFKPGVYYLEASGFSMAANGTALMSTGYADDPATGQGIVVFIHGAGIFDVGANGSLDLTGDTNGATYKNILFFVSRSSPAQTHSLGGGGAMTLRGTIYATNTKATMLATPAHHQTMNFGGGSCNTTQVIGEIITDVVTMSGNSCIKMTLNPANTEVIDQVALIR